MAKSSCLFLQANLGRGKIATNEIMQMAYEVKAPILLLQEPYTWKNTVVGLGRFSNQILTGNSEDETPWSCICVLQKDYTAVLIKDLSTSHCVVAHISGPAGTFFVCSLYCQFSHDIRVHLAQLDKVLQELRGERIIIASDVNAVSPLWTWRGDQVPDNRGTEVEGLIASRNLIVVNRPHEPCTYIRGQRDIDITVATTNIANHLANWSVKEDWISSDHRVIAFELTDQEVPRRLREPRYNTARADWQMFAETIKREANILEQHAVQNRTEIEELANKVTALIHKAAKRSMPKKKNFQKSVPWWNQELNAQKKDMNKRRKIYQRERNEAVREVKKQEYLRSRKRYSRQVGQTRTNSWREYIEENSRNNPYGMSYKIVTEKLSPAQAANNVKTESGHTRTWNETMSVLLDGLFGNEIPDDESGPEEDVSSEGNEETEIGWQIRDIFRALRTIKNGKAPGSDRIEVEMVKVAAKAGLAPVLLKLYNGCLAKGVFPKDWKRGLIRVLLKNKDKDKTEIKSYRPICLLSILSKLLEKLMRMKIENIILDPAHSSSRQYGYRRARSTEDAIAEVVNIVKSSEKHMVLALLFDITGAFDNLKWATILRELRKRGCKGNVLRLVKDYLTERRVEIVDNYDRVEKLLTKGCPQGSIVGPDFWNVCFDSLLKMLEEHGAEIVAYADDLIILVKGNSRREIEDRSQFLVNIVSTWCRQENLQISKSKTEMILLRHRTQTGKSVTKQGTKRILQAGSAVKSLIKTGKGGKRPPTVKLDETSLRLKDTVKYLGVSIGTGMTVNAHVHDTGAKTKRIFNRLKTVAKAHWGLDFGCLRTLYQGVFLPIMLYAVGAWEELMDSHARRALAVHQRYPLLAMCRSYNTVSTEALQVINGVKPLDLEASLKSLKYKVKKKIWFTFEDIDFNAESDPGQTAKDIETKITEIWQSRWNNSTKARTTFKYYPEVQERLSATWVVLDHYNVQFLTGHGDFRAKLKSFDLVDDELCSTCRAPETSEHVLWQCENYEDERQLLRQKLESLNLAWPASEKDLVTKDMFEEFTKFCRSALLRKRAAESARH